MDSTDKEKVFIVDLKLTEVERPELERACKAPIVFDKDCPETTPEMALKFRRVNLPRE